MGFREVNAIDGLLELALVALGGGIQRLSEVLAVDVLGAGRLAGLLLGLLELALVALRLSEVDRGGLDEYAVVVLVIVLVLVRGAVRLVLLVLGGRDREGRRKGVKCGARIESGIFKYRNKLYETSHVKPKIKGVPC